MYVFVHRGGRETEEQQKDRNTAGDDEMPKSLVFLRNEEKTRMMLCFLLPFFCWKPTKNGKKT